MNQSWICCYGSCTGSCCTGVIKAEFRVGWASLWRDTWIKSLIHSFIHVGRFAASSRVSCHRLCCSHSLGKLSSQQSYKFFIWLMRRVSSLLVPIIVEKVNISFKARVNLTRQRCLCDTCFVRKSFAFPLHHTAALFAQMMLLVFSVSHFKVTTDVQKSQPARFRSHTGTAVSETCLLLIETARREKRGLQEVVLFVVKPPCVVYPLACASIVFSRLKQTVLIY